MAEGGLGTQCGHDLDLHNLAYLAQALPNLVRSLTGHALICDAFVLGARETIMRYLNCLK